MKVAVTTTRDKDDLLKDKAEKIARELNIPYIKRDNLSIEKTIIKENPNGNITFVNTVDKDLFFNKFMENLKNIKD